MHSSRKSLIPFLIIAFVILVSLACGSSTPTSAPASVVTPAPVNTQVNSALPTVPPVTTEVPASATQVPDTPTNIPASPTKVPATVTKIPASPTPSYSEPVVLLEFSGTGDTVTDDFVLPACWKAVLYWHVAPSSYGTASLILTGYNKGSGADKTLVNDMVMDASADGMSGIAFDPLLGGTYYFQTENTDAAWNVRLECQDGVAPVGEGMNIQATGGFVTGNYSLPACNKSIFNWSVEPSNYGTTSLILALCNMKECETIVNEMKMDMTSAMTGQALQAVQGGDYFLVSENTQQPWSVNWECKD